MDSLASKLEQIPGNQDVHEWMHGKGWTVDLPVVPPTVARVLRMLQGTSRLGSEIIGSCPPCGGQVTVEKVAIAAVMAGCEPRQFCVLLAAVEAMLDERFNLHGVSCTTMGATPIVVINGPARLSAGLNFQNGATAGSGSRANACIGRALKLLVQNVGGSKLGGTESTTLGTPMKFGLCIAEWEEHLDEDEAGQWAPLHTMSYSGRSFEKVESAATVFAVVSGPHMIVDPELGLAGNARQNAEFLCRLLARAMHSAYSGPVPMINDCLLIISPEHYLTLVKGGIKTKSQLQKRLWDLSNLEMAQEYRTLLGRFKLPLFLGDVAGTALSIVSKVVGLASGAGLSAVPKFDTPESIHIVVAGGTAGKFSAFMPCFGMMREGPMAHLSAPVSKRVEVEAAVAAAVVAAEAAEVAGATVLVDPTAGDPQAFAPTARSQEGKLLGDVALLSISKRGSGLLLREVEKLLSQRFPGVAIKHYEKPTFSRPCPKPLLAKIAGECRHAVVALAD